MFRLSRRTGAPVATVTAVVVTGLAVGVPLLDQGRAPGPVAFADTAEAGYVDHHHGVCLQHSAEAWSWARGAELPAERFVREADTPRRGGDHFGRCAAALPQSRAPPLV
ncbi:MAG: hypothetical protein R3314_04625 [Longimicrobiales bacterium]|nr:hypothetical protein [Longimicrobiales bacterium]